MLLRRVIVHVKAQNWTAVALDFVIVVVGVFMGIQVSNWNDARADHERSENYLSRIQTDLEGDMHELQRHGRSILSTPPIRNCAALASWG